MGLKRTNSLNMYSLRYYNKKFVCGKNSTSISYKHKNGGSFGYIEYFKTTGKIIKIKSEDMNLKRDMLINAISDIGTYNDYVWCVAHHDHPFWENVLNHSFTFYKKLPYIHNANGYIMKIK